MNIAIIGGSGSIGNAFVKHCKDKYSKIIIYSRTEQLQYEMKKRFNNDEKLRFLIGNVRDKDRLKLALSGIDTVIHAAAMKHIDICENNPNEARKTNVMGTANVIEACIECSVKRAILISTDKCVNPLNLYGATKMAADKLFIAANNYYKTKFSVVRYGNVAESRGSVIPFFKEMVNQGSTSLPITHEDMTRFWITKPQAVELIQTAMKTMKGGETYIAKIPSFRITDLVYSMDCCWDDVGIRPGEKLSEQMITEHDYVYEYDNHYIVYPVQSDFFREENIHPGGEHKPNFIYSSDINKFLTIEQIRGLI